MIPQCLAEDRFLFSQTMKSGVKRELTIRMKCGILIQALYKVREPFK